MTNSHNTGPDIRRADRGSCYRWCPRYWCGLGLRRITPVCRLCAFRYSSLAI